MINEEFVLTFNVKGNKLSNDEIQAFEKAAGYSSDMSVNDKMTLYNDIHTIYDITMDELTEDEDIAIMPTYMLVMQHMKNKWF